MVRSEDVGQGEWCCDYYYHPIPQLTGGVGKIRYNILILLLKSTILP